MMIKKKAPLAAFMAAAIMSATMAGSMPAAAADEYILLLPASTDSSYALDQSHVSTTYSTDQYTILLYEEGETVQFQVFTNHGYTIQDAATATDFDDFYSNGKGNIFFTMPAKDLCFVLGTEMSTSGSTSNIGTSSSTSTLTDPSSMLTAETQTEDSGILDASDPDVDVFTEETAVDFIYDDTDEFTTDEFGLEVTDELDEPAIEIVDEEDITFDEPSEEETAEDYAEESTEEEEQEQSETESVQRSAAGDIVYTPGEIGMEIVLNGDFDGQVTLLNGNIVDIEQDGSYKSSEVIDILRVNSYSWLDNDPSINIWRDGELVEDTSPIILTEGGYGNNWYIDIRNSFDLDGYYVVQVTMDGYADRDIKSSDEVDVEESGSEDDEENGSIQIVLFDGLQAKAKAKNKKSFSIDKDGDTTIDTKLKNITITSDDGIPSSLEYEVYRNDEPIDSADLLGSEKVQKKGHVISMADDLAFDGDYKLIIMLADDNEFIDPDDIEEDETEEPEDEEDDSTNDVPDSGIIIVQANASNSVTEGDDFTFSVDVKDGYAKTDDFAVKANGVALEENDDGTYTISGISADQNVTVEGVADIISPSIEASVGSVTWSDESDDNDSIYFFKGQQTVEINAEDAGSGIADIQYYISETPISDPYEITDWIDYTDSVDLPQNEDVYIYVLAWDNDGNSSVLTSGKMVMYSDISSDAVSVSYSKASNDDVSIPIEMNGNSVNQVLVDGEALSNEEYSFEDGTLVVLSSGLDSLDSGDHTIEVTFMPLGDEYTDSSIGDKPDSLTVDLDITKIAGSVDSISDISKTFDGESVEEPSFESTNQGTAVIEYKQEDDADSSYTSFAPSDAGSYTVRVTVSEDDEYDAAVGTSDFTIYKGDVTITANNQSVIYGDDIQTDIDQAEVSGLPDGYEMSEVTITEDDGVIEIGNAVIVDENGKNATNNFSITYVDGTVEYEPIEQDAPEGLTSEAETIKGKADGKIDGLTTDMEYSTDGTNYTAVTDPDMDFASGDYYVRYAASDMLLASDPISVSVQEGKTLTIVFMVDSDIQETMDVEYGTSIDDSEIPAVTLPNGYTPVDAYWDVSDFSNITSDIVVHAVYTIEEFSVNLPSGVSVVTTSDESVDDEDEAEDTEETESNEADNESDETDAEADETDIEVNEPDSEDNVENDTEEDSEDSTEAKVFEVVINTDSGTTEESEAPETAAETEVPEDFSGVRIELEYGITADVAFEDGGIVSIDDYEPYTVTEKIDTITVYPDPDFGEQLDINLWENGAEFASGNNLFFIEAVADGIYTIRLSDDIDFDNGYHFSVTEADQ